MSRDKPALSWFFFTRAVLFPAPEAAPAVPLLTCSLSSPAIWRHLASLQALQDLLLFERISHHSDSCPEPPATHARAPGASNPALTTRLKKTLQLWQALPP